MQAHESSVGAYSGQTLALVGVPTDVHSSFLRGAARAPGAIREALTCDATSLWTEGALDLGAPGVLFDAGDLDLGQDGDDFDAIESGVGALMAMGARVLCMGGDHAITHPILRAVNRIYPQVSILHFDAHPDLYHDFEGDPRSHASPFARIMEEGLCSRLVQVGIRGINDHLREQIKRFGVEAIEMRDWEKVSEITMRGPTYVSFDLDVLDPAFAPGVSHWEPGGASTRQVLDVIHGLQASLIGVDVVELNPERDTQGVTAAVAARVLRELAGKMLENPVPTRRSK